MTVQLSPDPVFKAFDNNGEPLSGGLLYTYVAGTSTPQVTYTDSTQATPNTNPIVLNARGEAPLWLNVSLLYKFLLTDSLGNTIPGWPVDNIYPIQPGFPPNANGQYTIPAAIVQPTLTIGGDILARGVALCRYKTTTTSRTSSALFIDPDLQCVVTPGTYSIELTLGINNAGASGVTPGFAFGITFNGVLSTFATNAINFFGALNTATASGNLGINVTDAVQLASGVTSNSLTIIGSLSCSAGGLLGLQWAQAFTDAGAVGLAPGSYIKVTVLS